MNASKSAKYRAKANKKYYAKYCIDRKIEDIIRLSSDKRCFIFPKVLSSDQINACMLEHLPRKFYRLEDAFRLWTQDGNKLFSEHIRSQEVYFRSTDKVKEKDKGNKDKQTLLFQDFYLKVAEKLKLTNFALNPSDNVIKHAANLTVCIYIVIVFR